MREVLARMNGRAIDWKEGQAQNRTVIETAPNGISPRFPPIPTRAAVPHRRSLLLRRICRHGRLRLRVIPEGIHGARDQLQAGLSRTIQVLLRKKSQVRRSASSLRIPRRRLHYPRHSAAKTPNLAMPKKCRQSQRVKTVAAKVLTNPGCHPTNSLTASRSPAHWASNTSASLHAAERLRLVPHGP